jgi:ribonuclease P/MRP protein subunit RPP40
MGHVDPKQPPSKGKPWTAISELDFVHKVSPVVGQMISVSDALWSKIADIT